MLMLPQLSFKQDQLRYTRVQEAYQEKEITVKKYFSNKNLNYQGFELFLRAFKAEEILELWVREKGETTFTLLTSYPFCSSSGTLGPKRREGDLQIPEGIYEIAHFNPQSKFHLSLGINYPNKSDLLLSDKHRPGSEIYIHGNCVTIGCIPVSDDKIKELYILATEARNAGQSKIPVHIFPSRLTEETLQKLKANYPDRSDLHEFWTNLKPVYKSFEDDRVVRSVRVDSRGKYYL